MFTAAWSAWNFLGSIGNKLCLTYGLNVLQNINKVGLPSFVTLNPPHRPENMLLKQTTGHPIPSVAATKASLDLANIQGTRGIQFCGAYQVLLGIIVLEYMVIVSLLKFYRFA